MKAFLWSLCLHIVLIGLLTYHHFAPTDAAKVKPEPPILAYAYQPIKAVKAVPVQPQQEVTKVEQVIVPPMPVKKPNQQAPAKTPVKKPQKKNTSQKAKPKSNLKPTKAKVAQPKKKPFVPVRKPAMVKTPPVVPAPKPLPAPKVAEVVAAKPLPAPKVAEVVAAKSLPAPKVAEVVAAKPLPAPKVAEVVPAKPLPAAKVADPVATKPVPEAAKAKVADLSAKPKVVQGDLQNGPQQSARIQESADQLSRLLQKDKSMANKALQSAKPGDASGSGSWKEQQKQLALEITAQKAEPKPETGRKVKDFADGSMLIDTNPGCWKVPPAGSSKDSIWLSTSVPCKADTTVEQIDAILNKRRSYSRD